MPHVVRLTKASPVDELCKAFCSLSLDDDKDLTFSLFSKLPAELQLMIWSYALPGPRVIEINHRRKEKPCDFYLPPLDWTFPDSPFVFSHQNTKIKLKAIVDPIPLLYACHDSRTVALKTYRLAFNKILHRPVYFDPLQDTILLGNMSVMDDICSHRKASLLPEFGVRFLAVDPLRIRVFDGLPKIEGRQTLGLALWATAGSRWDAVAELVKLFGTLQELIILHHAPYTGQHFDHDYNEEFEAFLEATWAPDSDQNTENNDEGTEENVHASQAPGSPSCKGKNETWTPPYITYLEYKDTIDVYSMNEEVLEHSQLRQLVEREPVTYSGGLPMGYWNPRTEWLTPDILV